MSMSLANITTGGVKKPARIVAYGIDGIGKTTWASKSENPILIPTEDGATRIDVPQFPMVQSWPDVFDAIRALCKEPHDYETAIIDTADWAQHLATEHIIANDFNGDSDKFDAYGAGYKVLMREWRKLLSALDFLRDNKSMQVVLLLHATIKKFQNPMGDDYDTYKASLVDSPNTSIWGLTKEWADLVLFMNNKVMVDKASKNDTKGKGKYTKKRYIFTKPDAAYDAKVRAGWEMPDEMELDWGVFAQYLNKDAAVVAA